jgi:hypothetical protein
VTYPAGTIVGETEESSAGVLALGNAVGSDPGPPVFYTSAADPEDPVLPTTLIAPGGAPYQLLEGWYGLGYPSAGSCGLQLLAVQG